MQSFEPVIGLEVHVQLDTANKLFCPDRAGFGAQPNTAVCPVCLGLPGALPVLNRDAVDLAVRAALGLHCTVHPLSGFARKHYFYPDLAKGYQITQHDRPLATGGWLAVPEDDGATGAGRRIRIRRVHLEEDAGKSLHDRFPARTAIDFNRAGIPLIEIVTEPDLSSPAQARMFLVRLKRLLQYLDISECEMEKGSLRVDANVSVRTIGSSGLGVRTEVKNMNTFSGVARALQHEIDRQVAILKGGGMIVRQTRRWDAGAAATRPLRSKEAARDYRYMPEPDLAPLVLDEAWIQAEDTTLPESPQVRTRRFEVAYGLSPGDAAVLTRTRALADYFEALAAETDDPSLAAAWVRTDVLAWLNREGVGIGAFPILPIRLAELIRMVEDGILPRGLARKVLRRMATSGRTAADILEADGRSDVRDAPSLAGLVDEVMRGHPEEVRRYRLGETRLLNFFMGQIMTRTGGRAHPGKARDLLESRLSE